MEVICESCKVKLTINDEKLPLNSVFATNCPRCKSKITVDTRKNNPALPSLPSSSEKQLPEVQKSSHDSKSNNDDFLEGLDEIDKLGLILIKRVELSDNIMKSLESMDYHPVQSFDTQDALNKMRYHHFNIVILGDHFDNISSNNFLISPTLTYFNSLSMSIRRRIFLTLIGERFKTLNEMMAYAYSANLVVNVQDINKFSEILSKSFKEYQRFYKVFMDTLAQEGKI